MHLSIEPNPRIACKLRYQDEHLLVVEKRPRLATVPGKGHLADTLLNGLFAIFGPQLQNVGKARDFGMMHRLDRDTSGLLIVALSPAVYDALAERFRRREVAKFYWAVTRRSPAKTPSGAINRPIIEEEKEKKLARVSAAGKPALTAYRVLQANHLAALLECRAVTGRLHQVRVHLASIGCAILGDGLYANPAVAAATPRLALHAHRLVFAHPVGGQQLDVRSPLPRDMAALLKRVQLDRPSHQGHQVGGDAVGQ